MFYIAYAFKGQVHVFAGRVKFVSDSSCRTSAIFKYFLSPGMDNQNLLWIMIPTMKQDLNIGVWCTLSLNSDSIIPLCAYWTVGILHAFLLSAVSFFIQKLSIQGIS